MGKTKADGSNVTFLLRVQLQVFDGPHAPLLTRPPTAPCHRRPLIGLLVQLEPGVVLGKKLLKYFRFRLETVRVELYG